MSGKQYYIYNVSEGLIENEPLKDGDIIYIAKKPYKIRKEGSTFALLPIEERRPRCKKCHTFNDIEENGICGPCNRNKNINVVYIGG